MGSLYSNSNQSKQQITFKMAESFNGTFVLTEKDAENFEKYMIAVGVNFVTRKAGKNLSQTIIIEVSGNNIHIKTQSTFKSSDEKYTFGVPAKVTTMDGRATDTTLTYNSSDNSIKLVEEWKGKSTSHVWTIEGNNLVLTLDSHTGVICRRVYAKQ